MPMQIDVGDSSTAAPNIIPIGVSPGQTITLTCLTGSNASVIYYINGIDQAGVTLTAGNNVALTVPAWLQPSGGVATVTLAGGIYG